ncbi:hypothetical protein J5226_19830 [Lysobacter sp. K5869]|uniref:hypothetical protein n=1 Tax=Lysobacter sp. K5869 TaxID=2820808 RepID=UPI001C064363|nr:hypothetical protein [Lysobacter sp. K5869]QWP75835.1 hypothetical protein J5226_19830 [Lysobacter sp. K5869]
MKTAEEIAFAPDSPQLIVGKLSLKAFQPKDDRPADVIYSLHGQEHIERGFASLTYSSSSHSLVPVTELIRWKNFLLVLGRRSCLVFDREAGRLADTVALNRRETDDTGFYDVKFQDSDQILVVVYESGIFAVTATGVLWHHHKTWDELVTSIDADSIVVTTGDEGQYTLETQTGHMN